MIQAYHSGDPYLAFAKQAGAAPPHATKDSHDAIREQFKRCALGTLYNMGANTLAERTGLYIPYAAELLRLHRKTYPQFWQWSNRVVDYGLLHNHLFTTFGWNLFLEGEPNPNSLRNFPMQANGAEMLRLACCLAVERGVKVIAPVHDALLIEARGGDTVGAVMTTRRAMAEASAIVLGGMTLRTEFDVYRFPLRYMNEKRGRKMWNMVWRIIRELEAGK
jgi:DNA polymerase I-like protein with 3'-5' exonuclease and polymerase domains